MAKRYTCNGIYAQKKIFKSVVEEEPSLLQENHPTAIPKSQENREYKPRQILVLQDHLIGGRK